MLKKDKLSNEKSSLVEDKHHLETLIKQLDDQIANMTFPLDFSGDEPKDDPFWNFINSLIDKGYLNTDITPTKVSLENDYIRFNDGSKVFEDVGKQPLLIFTGKFLSKIRTEIPNPYEQ